MNAFEMRLKTGLTKMVKPEVTPETIKYELIEKARKLLASFGTLRQASDLTGIQITRVHRLVADKREMKATEMLLIFQAANKQVVVNEQV